MGHRRRSLPRAVARRVDQCAELINRDRAESLWSGGCLALHRQQWQHLHSMLPAWSRSIKCAFGNRRHGSCPAGVPRPSQTSSIRCDTILGVFWPTRVMKQLLLLTFVAFASEAMAQDVQRV